MVDERKVGVVGLAGKVCSAGKEMKMRAKGRQIKGWMRLNKPCGWCKSHMDCVTVRGGEVSVRRRWDL